MNYLSVKASSNHSSGYIITRKKSSTELTSKYLERAGKTNILQYWKILSCHQIEKLMYSAIA